jgi:hypothetical protein
MWIVGVLFFGFIFTVLVTTLRDFIDDKGPFPRRFKGKGRWVTWTEGDNKAATFMLWFWLLGFIALILYILIDGN